MAQRGILDSFTDTMQSPLFLGGAALLSGDGFGGAMKGMAVGNQFQNQQRALAEQTQQKAAYDDFLGNLPKGLESYGGMLRAAGPERGFDVASRLMPKPMSPMEIEMNRLGIDYKRAQLGALRDEQRQMAAVNGILTGAEQPATPTTEAVPTDGAGRFAQPAVNPTEQPSVVFGSRELSLPQAMQVATAIAKRNPAMAKYLMDEVKRAQIEPKLLGMGIDPASAEGQTYMLTGRLPAKAYEKMANTAKRSELTGKVDAGLTNLLDTANTTNDTSFESALGPFQGSTPDSLAGAVPINIARVWGEISNFMGGGNISPSEVRSNITGATEALAGAIKPLIRGPGEGPWTDADQSRLVSIVGDLAQARNKDEYRRRLNSVRDRISSNFGLDLKFDAKGEGNDALRKKYGLE